MLTVGENFVFRNFDLFFRFSLAQPYISPSSPLLLYPVNRTFTITCSLLCDWDINFDDFLWFVNGELLDRDNHDFRTETISAHTQRLTVYLNKRNRNFIEANYTCAYAGKEASIFVRRRTSESKSMICVNNGNETNHLVFRRRIPPITATAGFLLTVSISKRVRYGSPAGSNRIFDSLCFVILLVFFLIVQYALVFSAFYFLEVRLLRK